MTTSHSPAEPAGPRKHTVRNVLIAVAILILILLLLLRSCHKAAPGAPPFDYFTAKAAELGNDSNRIIAFVRDDMPLLDYRGDARGALGALWNGSASAEEKVLLANALLTAGHCGKTASLDDLAPSRDKSHDSPRRLKANDRAPRGAAWRPVEGHPTLRRAGRPSGRRRAQYRGRR